MASGFGDLRASRRGAGLLGVDLARTSDGDIDLSFGQLQLTKGEQVALDDIAERVRTQLGTEFYDARFGSLVEDFVEAPDTERNRLALLIRLVQAVQADPRVQSKSATATVRLWTNEPRQIQARVRWLWVGAKTGGNLVVTIGREGVAAVAGAYNPTRAAEEA